MCTPLPVYTTKSRRVELVRYVYGGWGCGGGGAIREVQHNLLCYKEHKDVIHVYLSFALGSHMHRSVPMVTIDYLQVDDTEVSTIVVTVMQVLLTLSAIYNILRSYF